MVESATNTVMTTKLATATPQLTGEVRFRREGDQLCVEHAPPVMWFARHVLERTRPNPDIGLSFDGTHVTLKAPNGQWVWRLTGRTLAHRYAPDGEPVVMVEGVWPD